MNIHFRGLGAIVLTWWIMMNRTWIASCPHESTLAVEQDNSSSLQHSKAIPRLGRRRRCCHCCCCCIVEGGHCKTSDASNSHFQPLSTCDSRWQLERFFFQATDMSSMQWVRSGDKMRHDETRWDKWLELANGLCMMFDRFFFRLTASAVLQWRGKWLLCLLRSGPRIGLFFLKRGHPKSLYATDRKKYIRNPTVSHLQRLNVRVSTGHKARSQRRPVRDWSAPTTAKCLWLFLLGNLNKYCVFDYLCRLQPRIGEKTCEKHAFLVAGSADSGSYSNCHQVQHVR